MNNYFELAKTCIELLGNLCLWVIALTAVTMGIFGGSVSIKINGFERFFRQSLSEITFKMIVFCLIYYIEYDKVLCYHKN